MKNERVDTNNPKILIERSGKKLKEINPKIKVIISSGYSVNGEAQDMLKSGACGFIQKPYRVDELSATVRRYSGSLPPAR